MKKTRKILAMAACAILLVCISVGATVAYLTSQDTVTNTFTVGQVKIKLDEAKTNDAGKALKKTTDAESKTIYEVTEDVSEADRVKANTYKLMPGHSYIKDPTVHFAAYSEASYLFVKVENGIADIEAPYTYGSGEASKTKTIAEQIADNGWTVLSTGSNVYWRKVDANTTDDAINYINYKVFDGFKIKDDIEAKPATPMTDVKYLEDYKDKTIIITAYAVQADGFANATAAWNATFGKTDAAPEQTDTSGNGNEG